MGKLWFVNFFVFTFLIWVILGCQSRQQKDSHNNIAEVSQELSKKIINDIYEKKDN